MRFRPWPPFPSLFTSNKIQAIAQRIESALLVVQWRFRATCNIQSKSSAVSLSFNPAIEIPGEQSGPLLEHLSQLEMDPSSMTNGPSCQNRRLAGFAMERPLFS